MLTYAVCVVPKSIRLLDLRHLRFPGIGHHLQWTWKQEVRSHFLLLCHCVTYGNCLQGAVSQTVKQVFQGASKKGWGEQGFWVI